MAAIIAISIKMVGLLLITGMLIIPAAMARNLSNNPVQMVVYSVIGGLLSVIAGFICFIRVKLTVRTIYNHSCISFVYLIVNKNK